MLQTQIAIKISNACLSILFSKHILSPVWFFIIIYRVRKPIEASNGMKHLFSRAGDQVTKLYRVSK